MAWRNARAIDVLGDEINTAYPGRSKASDGTIGDAAHASRDSDHNPWVIKDGQGIVRARDVTHDPAHGCDCEALFDAICALLAAGTHPALRHGAYAIFRSRIFSFDRRTEGVRHYGGPGLNPHDHHMHVSVSLDPAGFDSTAPWGITEEVDPMADYEGQLDRIERKLDRGQKRDVALRKLIKDLVETAAAVDFDAVMGEQVEALKAIRARLTKIKRAIDDLDQDDD